MTGKFLKISILSYFFISLVLNGLQRLSGLFVLELLQSMTVSRQDAVVPFTFSWAVANIMASFSDSLIDKKKSEYIILFGILLTATGAALCMLTTNITTLLVFWGFIFGSGYGIATPHLSRRLKSVNSCKLSFFLQATPSLGVTVMPFVLHMLTSYYGLQGSYLIISGIILNYLPLSVAAAYNIELRLPNIKWRVRKRSSQYVVSEQERGQIVSVESFVNSLEPDLILRISQNDECQDERNSDIDNSVLCMKKVFPIGRKRSETRGNDLQALEMDPRVFPPNANHSSVAVEIQKYENRRNPFEGSFSNKDIITYDEGKEESNNIINCDKNNSAKTLEKNILNTEPKSDLNLKYDILNKMSEHGTNEAVVKSTESEKCLEISSRKNNIAKDQNCIQSKKEISHTFNEKRDSNTALTEKKTGHEILSETGNEENPTILSEKRERFGTEKAPIKGNSEPSPICLQNESLKIPLDIKVHVEEYTFISDGEYWYQNITDNYENATKNRYRNHSNSIVPEMYANTDFTCQRFSKSFFKCSELHKPKLSSIYSISENSESGGTRISEEKNNEETEQNKCMKTALKIKRIFKFLNEITSPGSLCIILITIIFEINLVTLVTMFADLGNDIDNNCSDFKWILVAFGAGGIIGKFCCCKISRTIPEKSHAIGVVLFLLNGLSTAGVLFSTNLNWLAGFYGILGALEGGITYTIPKFILEYIDRNRHTTLSSVKSLLSGVAMICIPYVIGLSRDELGDYEFLLQTMSCSSILCAFLVYFLPYLSTASEGRKLTTSFKDNIEIP